MLKKLISALISLPLLATALQTKYPELPYSLSYLEVEPNWQIAYTEVGNPKGIPVLFVHGGPGANFKDGDLRWFNPDKYRIIAFDQRGTGRSRPSPGVDSFPASHYASITIDTFTSDMEKLREHLGIDQWLVFGGSWGSALSLYYGEQHPERTLGLVLRGIFLALHSENDRFYSAEALTKELGDVWDPKSLEEMYKYAESKGVSFAKTPQGFLDAFYELVLVKDDFQAMHLWTEFEEYVDSPSPAKLAQMLTLPKSVNEIPPGIQTTAIFEILFFRNLPDTVDLLDPLKLDNIKTIPVYIVQGVQDSVCPKEMATLLAESIKSAGGTVDLHLIEGEKHSPGTPGMTDALISITDGF